MSIPRDCARLRSTLLVGLAAGCLIAVALSPARADDPAPAEVAKVRIETSLGNFVVQLEPVRAPLTTANFLWYVKNGHYAGTVFHRVISNFVAQGGGYDEKYQLKTVRAAVPNESGNGLSNKRGTIGLARSDFAHSGNAQFYLNLTDNDDLDPTPLRWGYAVFGHITEGLEVADRIGHAPTGAVGPWPKDAPLDAVVIKRIEMLSADGLVIPPPAPAAANPPAATAAPAPGAPPSK